MKPSPVTDYVITERLEMERRGLKDETVRLVLSAAEQRMEVRPGRIVLQARLPLGAPARAYLVRVFVDVDRRPPDVVTVYRASRISKYWEEGS